MTSNSNSPVKACFCGNPVGFSNCCLPLINGSKHALTAEQLMRSRYSAFCVGDVDYLIETLAPEKRQQDDRQQIQQTIDNTCWLGLKIIATDAGLVEQQSGEVEFVAFYDEGKVAQLHERSQFIKLDNRWFYLEGQHLPPIKLGRNEPCFCGSGKKFKKCHA